MDELKPCPFCGAIPNIGKWKEAIDQSDTCPTAIECSSGLEECRVQPGVCDWSREEAIAAWNRRTPEKAE